MKDTLLRFIAKYGVDFLVGFVGVILGIAVVMLVKYMIKHVKAGHLPKENHTTFTFSKIAMGLLFAITALIVLVSFFVADPRFSISEGIIWLLGLMIFIVFSDSIEDFSIANFVTLKKEVKDKNAQVSKLSSENSELRTQLTSIVSASIHNQNLNNVVFGIGDSFLKYAQVEQATKEEVNTSSVEEHPAPEHDETNTEDVQRIRKASFLRSRFYAKADQKMLDKFAFKMNYRLRICSIMLDLQNTLMQMTRSWSIVLFLMDILKDHLRKSLLSVLTV